MRTLRFPRLWASLVLAAWQACLTQEWQKSLTLKGQKSALTRPGTKLVLVLTVFPALEYHIEYSKYSINHRHRLSETANGL